MSRSVALLLMLTLAGPVSAAEGVTEINQAIVDDAGGFPFVITDPGSYALTGNLELPALTTTGILIGAEDVTLNLRGFAVRGPNTCTPGNCSNAFSGVGVASLNPRTTVRNGTVTGTGNDCILLDVDSLVENVLVAECGGDGIQVGERSVIRDSRSIAVRQWGMRLRDDCTFSGNLIAQSALGGGNFGAVSAGSAGSDNLCDDGSCSPRGKRYYLTTFSVAGNLPKGVCDDGFHMASMWELLDTSNLHYDVTRGETSNDSGSGPPSTDPMGGCAICGWIRTGTQVSLPPAGQASCAGWNSTAGTGTRARLSNDWTTPPDWVTDTADCDAPQNVWCVED